jgi:hypothetical protein
MCRHAPKTLRPLPPLMCPGSFLYLYSYTVICIQTICARLCERHTCNFPLTPPPGTSLRSIPSSSTASFLSFLLPLRKCARLLKRHTFGVPTHIPSRALHHLPLQHLCTSVLYSSLGRSTPLSAGGTRMASRPAADRNQLQLNVDTLNPKHIIPHGAKRRRTELNAAPLCTACSSHLLFVPCLLLVPAPRVCSSCLLFMSAPSPAPHPYSTTLATFCSCSAWYVISRTKFVPKHPQNKVSKSVYNKSYSHHRT